MLKAEPVTGEKVFSQQVGATAARKLHAQRHATRTIWSGLGMIGLVGWSVAVPTLLGTALGVWLDQHFPGSHSYTLLLLTSGLALGCVNAWHWVDKENREILQEQEHE